MERSGSSYFMHQGEGKGAILVDCELGGLSGAEVKAFVPGHADEGDTAMKQGSERQKVAGLRVPFDGILVQRKIRSGSSTQVIIIVHIVDIVRMAQLIGIPSNRQALRCSTSKTLGRIERAQLRAQHLAVHDDFAHALAGSRAVLDPPAAMPARQDQSLAVPHLSDPRTAA